MKNANENRIYIEFWDADTNETEWRPFAPEEIDELMDSEILDCDMLGYAMKDSEAFEKALLEMSERKTVFHYSDFVKAYLNHTTEDIRIKA